MKSCKGNDEYNYDEYNYDESSLISIPETLNKIIITILSSKLFKSYKFSKDCTLLNAPKILSSPKIKLLNSDEDINGSFNRLNSLVIGICNMIKNNLPHVDLNILLFNLKDLRITVIDNKTINKKHHFHNSYNAFYNEIILDKDSYLKYIFHNFFHVASTIFNSKTGKEYSGFSQRCTKSDNKIGYGLNEGYTELLTSRYFDKCNVSDSYELERFYAIILEKIIDQKVMESLYFKADLLGLVKELKNYALEKDIINFITNLDFLNKHLRRKISIVYLSEINEKIRCVSLFLINCYETKLSIMVKQRKIDEQLAQNLLNEFNKSFSYEVQKYCMGSAIDLQLNPYSIKNEEKSLSL